MHQLVSQPTHLNNEGKPSSLLDLKFTNTPHLFSSSAEVMAPLATSDPGLRRIWDDFNVDTYQKFSWGSGGRCEPSSGVRGSAPEIFEIYGVFHLRGPILANFRELFRCFVAEGFSE